MSDHCEYVSDHEPGETCEHCGLEVDQYGNTAEDFQNCCFPDCGCDGARPCQAPSGASESARTCNVEGMYSRTDRDAIIGRMSTFGVCMDLEKAKKEKGSHP